MREKERDTFDRTFIGKPGCMLSLILLIIIISVVYNYFK